MMKKSRNLLALILAFAVCVGCGGIAMALEDTPENPVAGVTGDNYKVYIRDTKAEVATPNADPALTTYNATVEIVFLVEPTYGDTKCRIGSFGNLQLGFPNTNWLVAGNGAGAPRDGGNYTPNVIAGGLLKDKEWINNVTPSAVNEPTTEMAYFYLGYFTTTGPTFDSTGRAVIKLNLNGFTKAQVGAEPDAESFPIDLVNIGSFSLQVPGQVKPFDMTSWPKECFGGSVKFPAIHSITYQPNGGTSTVTTPSTGEIVNGNIQAGATATVLGTASGKGVAITGVGANANSNLTPAAGGTFTPPASKKFAGWTLVSGSVTLTGETTPVAVGGDIAPGATFTIADDVVLEAKWVSDLIFTLSPNGGSWADGSTDDKTFSVEDDGSLTMPGEWPSAVPTKTGSKFLGYWNKQSASGINDADAVRYIASGDLFADGATGYAVWVPDTDANNDGIPDVFQVKLTYTPDPMAGGVLELGEAGQTALNGGDLALGSYTKDATTGVITEYVNRGGLTNKEIKDILASQNLWEDAANETQITNRLKAMWQSANVTADMIPTPTANTGYDFKEWTATTPTAGTFDVDTEFTAHFVGKSVTYVNSQPQTGDNWDENDTNPNPAETAGGAHTVVAPVSGTDQFLAPNNAEFSHYLDSRDGSERQPADVLTGIEDDMELTAYWKATAASNKYSVLYYPNPDGDGNGVAVVGNPPLDTNMYDAANSTVTVKNNTAAHGAGPMTREGYTFLHWNTASDGSGTNYLPEDTFTITENTKLYAIWKADDTVEPNKQVDISWFANLPAGKTPGDVSNMPTPASNVNLAAPATVAYAGTSTVTAKDPELDGYAFYGWYETSAAANAAGTAKIRTGAVLLSQANGGAPEQQSQTVNSGSKTYYAAWGSVSVEYVNSVPNAADNWTAANGNPYPVSGGTHTVLTPVSGTDRFTPPADMEFSHYLDSRDGSIAPAVGQALTGIVEDMQLTAYWKATAASNKFSVLYYPNPDGDGKNVPVDGNPPVDSVTYSPNAEVTVKGNTAPMTREGYIFLGWNTAKDGTGLTYMPGNRFAITANTELYAMWKADATTDPTNTLDVTFLANLPTGVAAGTLSGMPNPSIYPNKPNPTVVAYGGTKDVTVTDPALTDYEFMGWYDSASAAAAAAANNSKADALLYNGEGATETQKSNNISASTTYYASWRKLADFVVKYEPGEGGAASNWTENPYSVQEGKTHTVENGTGTGRFTAPSGKVFTHYLDDQGNERQPNDSLVVERDITLTAYWKSNQANAFTVTYYPNPNNPSDADADKNIVLNAPPVDAKLYVTDEVATILGNDSGMTRAGYTFICWNTKADGSGTNYAVGDQYKMTANLDLYAVWVKSDTYTVSWFANVPAGETANGMPTPPITRDLVQGNTTAYTGGNVTAVDPTCSGNYVFTGWYRTKAAADASELSSTDYVLKSGSAKISDPVTGHMTYYAGWVEMITITYDNNGGDATSKVIPAQQEKANASVVLSDNTIDPASTVAFIKSGYTLLGWDTDRTKTANPTYSLGQTVSAGFADNVTLYAIWASTTKPLAAQTSVTVMPTPDSEAANQSRTITFTLTDGSRYGFDAVSAYIDTLAVNDATWAASATGAIPTGAKAVACGTALDANDQCTATVTGFTPAKGTTYYLHLKNTNGAVMDVPVIIDTESPSAALKTVGGSDGVTQYYSIEVKDVDRSAALPGYAPHGVTAIGWATSGTLTAGDWSTVNFTSVTGLKQAKNDNELSGGDTGYYAIAVNTEEVTGDSVFIYLRDSLGNVSVTEVPLTNKVIRVTLPTWAGLVARKPANGDAGSTIVDSLLLSPEIVIENNSASPVKAYIRTVTDAKTTSKLQLASWSAGSYTTTQIALRLAAATRAVNNPTDGTLNVDLSTITDTNEAFLGTMGADNGGAHGVAFTIQGRYRSDIVNSSGVLANGWQRVTPETNWLGSNGQIDRNAAGYDNGEIAGGTGNPYDGSWETLYRITYRFALGN